MSLSDYMTLKLEGENPCWQFLELIYLNEMGIKLPLFPLTPHKLKGWQRVEKGREQLMDILLFRETEHTSHVGLCVGSSEMLHYSTIGPVVERYKKPAWDLRSIYRHE